MRHPASILIFAISLIAQSACIAADKQAEQRRLDCLDKICAGDNPPTPGLNEKVFKLNGAWYVAPRQYVTGGAGLAFYWSSKTPVAGRPDRQPYPEQRAKFYDAAIEIFMRSTNMPAPNATSWYQQLVDAEAQDRLVNRTVLRPGLELWRIRRPDGTVSGPLYVATNLKGPDGNPPVLGCDEGKGTFRRCTTGFRWRPEVWAGIRFNSKHASDWPEIYEEIVRVLQLVRKT